MQWLIGLFVVVVLIAAYWYWQQQKDKFEWKKKKLMEHFFWHSDPKNTAMLMPLLNRKLVEDHFVLPYGIPIPGSVPHHQGTPMGRGNIKWPVKRDVRYEHFDY